MLMGMPVVLLPIQILIVNLVTDGLPAIALGLEPAEKDIMRKPPRKKQEGIFSDGLLSTIVFRGILIGLTTLAVFTSFYHSSQNLVVASNVKGKKSVFLKSTCWIIGNWLQPFPSPR